MISTTLASLRERYGLHSTGLDGASDRNRPAASPPSDLARYDADKDVDAVPRYTREYLRGLVTDLNARLRRFDEATSDYRETLDEIRAMQRWQLGVLLVLTLLWLATVLVIALVRPKGKPMVGGHVGQSKW